MYEKPKMELVLLMLDDIVTSSGQLNNQGQLGTGDFYENNEGLYD